MEQKPLVIAIVGPTSSGKTALSIALARKLDSEVIACDSRTIYKDMDIGTAKPTMEERDGIKHHLLDVAEPDQVFTAAQFRQLATDVIENLHERGKIPIVCGGTGFYARALLEGLSIPEVAPQEEMRKELQQLAETEGNAAVRKLLEEIDPASLSKIQENDLFRMIRAIEVTRVLSKPFSEAATTKEVPFDVIWIGLGFEDREVLRDRIESRLQQQLDDGLVEESRELLSKYGKTRSLVNAVTYKQMINYLEGTWTYEEAVQDCIRHNYQLARKQLMWFRSNPNMNWFLVDQTRQLKKDVFDYIDGILENRH